MLTSYSEVYKEQASKLKTGDMRKLKLVVQISIDGFAADSKGNTDWLVWNWSPKWTWDKPLQKVHENIIASADTVLHSRNMINGQYLVHWNEVASKPGNQQRFAKNLLKMKNYAFSRCLKSGPRENAEVINEDLTIAVSKLKRRKGKDMLAFGGVSFVSSLIKAKVVDEFFLFVNPIILGKGKSLYQSISVDQTVKLKKATPYKCGVVVLHYVKA